MRLAGHVARKETGEVQTGFLRVGLRERDHLEDTVLEGRIIVKWDVGWRSMNWIDLAQDSDRWWALVNAVMNFWIL